MLCWTRYLFIAVVVTLGTLSMLGACGQKGPLSLPDETPAKTTTPGADVPVVPATPATSATRTNLP